MKIKTNLSLSYSLGYLDVLELPLKAVVVHSENPTVCYMVVCDSEKGEYGEERETRRLVCITNGEMVHPQSNLVNFGGGFRHVASTLFVNVDLDGRHEE